MDFPRLLGGAPALDFVNTIDPRLGPDAVDYLHSPQALRAWARHARLAETGWLGAGELERALTLREDLHALFAATAQQRRPPAAALEHLRDAYAGVLSRAQLARARDGHWHWRIAQRHGVDALLLAVLESALELLRDGARVRECPGENCGWLFLDATRNASRRWCSMEGCGSRAKMRRYRAARASAGS
jgi:predicted RNA-binding Zn ribbon-like protein